LRDWEGEKGAAYRYNFVIGKIIAYLKWQVGTNTDLTTGYTEI
jgi:hypothetical protein